MARIRIGKDFNVIWDIYAKNAGERTPYDLSAADCVLLLVTPYNKVRVEDAQITGNQVSWTFRGKDLRHVGAYGLELIERKGEVMMTVDTCEAFELVEHSCEENADGSADVKIQTLRLEGDVLLAPVSTGGSSYDDTEIKAELSKKAEVHGILSIDSIIDVIYGEFGAARPMENADVDAIREGKLIAADSPMYGYVLADEVYYTDDDSGFIVFHYDGYEIRLQFNLADKVYLRKGSYQKAIALEDYVDGKLTELSDEIKEVSDRVDDLEKGGQGGKEEVFIAEFEKTTFAEILTAYNDGKEVLCNYKNQWIARLDRTQSTQYTFSAQAYPNILRIICNDRDEWTYASFSADHALKHLSNGNVEIKITNQSAEVATPQYVENAIQQSGTPSGDTMHYIFEACGATYNATDADIPMVGMYGDSYVHKAHHWHLNELGDITNEEMRQIYLYANLDNGAKAVNKYLAGIATRTNIATWSSTWNGKIKDQEAFAYANNVIVARMRNKEHYIDTNASFAFVGCTALQKILPSLDATSTTSFNGAFDNCNNLREVRIKNAKVAIKFDKSPLISKASILYLIQNSAATSAMVITLHADAYARLVEDADIVAALDEKTNVSLAK